MTKSKQCIQESAQPNYIVMNIIIIWRENVNETHLQ